MKGLCKLSGDGIWNPGSVHQFSGNLRKHLRSHGISAFTRNGPEKEAEDRIIYSKQSWLFQKDP